MRPIQREVGANDDHSAPVLDNVKSEPTAHDGIEFHGLQPGRAGAHPLHQRLHRQPLVVDHFTGAGSTRSTTATAGLTAFLPDAPNAVRARPARRDQNSVWSFIHFGRDEALGSHAEPVFAAANIALQQTGPFENADLARHTRKRHGEGLSQLRDPGRALAQSFEECPPRWIRQRRVGPVERLAGGHVSTLVGAEGYLQLIC